MIDMNTPQPTTDDSNWNDIRWEENDRINPKTAQGEQSSMVQLDFGSWAKENGLWPSTDYELMVKMYHNAISDVNWAGNYRYGEPVYETEYDGMEIAFLVHTREGHVL
jgi:hypothetical protein